MGFKARPVYQLEFAADTGLDGLEVSALGADVDTYLAFVRDDDLPPADRIEKRMRRFAPLLVAWNLEDDDDQPIPATYEGMRVVDQRIVGQIVAAWMREVVGVQVPLAGRSTSGGTPSTLPDLDLPMESPSPPT